MLRTQSDERLVDLVRVGNDGAFEAIVKRYRRQLVRYCSTILPEARADDAVQQTFLRAYEALRASEGEMNLRPWLYRIAHNQSLNALRDRSLGHEELSESIDGVERPDQAFDKHERLRYTVAAVSALPERQRNAIVLRELEGRSYEEIAGELGVTGGAVRQLLNRARGTLRAGATAITPFGLMARIPWAGDGSEAMGARVAELCGVGAGGAIAAKACATVLVTGAVVGGVASSPDSGTSDSRATERPAAVTPARGASGTSGGPGGLANTAADDSTDEARRSGPGRGRDDDGDDDRSGRRGGESEDRSGRGGGDDGAREDDSSGSGKSGSGSDDSSGSGSSGSGSSGSGSSGSGSSGSGSGGDDSGPGSSGSGKSGSGGGDDDPLVDD